VALLPHAINSLLAPPRAYDRTVAYISEHLSSLRQEITQLTEMNARYAEHREHNEIEQTARELRTNRLLEIKKELAKMLDRPEDPAVWWDRSRRSNQVA
jgi:hypothetical protein